MGESVLRKPCPTWVSTQYSGLFPIFFNLVYISILLEIVDEKTKRFKTFFYQVYDLNKTLIQGYQKFDQVMIDCDDIPTFKMANRTTRILKIGCLRLSPVES